MSNRTNEEMEFGLVEVFGVREESDMQKITVEMVRSWEPWYDPTEAVSDDWEGTALDVLYLPIPAEDKLWVVLRKEVLPEATLHEFSRWCALRVEHLWDMPDVVREYLKTGNEELRAAARAAASSAAAAARAAALAAGDAAWAAVWDAAVAAGATGTTAWAARDAAQDARYAAWAAGDASWDAAWAAAGATGTTAWAAARDAALDAAAGAAGAAAGAAWDDARAAARDAQIEKLKEMLASRARRRRMDGGGH